MVHNFNFCKMATTTIDCYYDVKLLELVLEKSKCLLKCSDYFGTYMLFRIIYYLGHLG